VNWSKKVGGSPEIVNCQLEEDLLSLKASTDQFLHFVVVSVALTDRLIEYSGVRTLFWSPPAFAISANSTGKCQWELQQRCFCIVGDGGHRRNGTVQFKQDLTGPVM